MGDTVSDRDRPLVGILLMTGFCVLAPLGDATAKVLGETMPLLALLAARFVVQAAILVPVCWASGRRLTLPGRIVWLTALRTVLHIVGIGAMFAALRYMPLADTVAIAFVMPFIMLLLGRTVLGEEVGARRLAACAVGFCGTLLVVQPSFAEVGAPALLPLLVAVVFSFFMLITRQIARAADPVVLQAVSGVMASAMLIAALLAMPESLPAAPGMHESRLLLLVGGLGTVAHLLMTWSLRYAPTSTLAPMQYLEIPFATLIGWLVFRDLPNGLAACGIAITVAAGLYVIYRERIAARRQTVAEPGA